MAERRRCFGSGAGAESTIPLELPPDTPIEVVQLAIENVASKADEWTRLPASTKRDLFKQCLHNLKAEENNLVQAGCASRGYDLNDSRQGHLVAEAYSNSVVVIGAWINAAIALLDELAQKGCPLQGTRVMQRPDGTSRILVYPNNLKETLLADGGKFEVVVRPNANTGEIETFSPLDAPASLTGTLGAGNTDIPNDIIDPMVKLNSVVVYKANPVMALGSRVKERIFQPLVERGYLAFVYGGIAQGQCIAESPKVDRLMMTGSCHTFDKIVWSGRDKSDPSIGPAVTKPVIAELGSVNPYIVVPGDSAWSDKDIDTQAEHLVAYKMQNGCHICAAPQVLVTCRKWPQREQFLNAVRQKLTAYPATASFYPGASSIYDKHATRMGEASFCKRSDSLSFGDKQLTPVFQTDVWRPGEAKEGSGSILGLSEEAFSPVLVEVAVDSEPTLPDFLPAAVEFCHSNCWGSLTCSIVVDDATKRNHESALDASLDDMQFGVIGINCPPSSANAFPVLSWSAYPRHSLRDVQSGIGSLGNFCCYENQEKVIMNDPFRNPHAFRYPGNRREIDVKLGRRLSGFFVNQSYVSLVKFASAKFLKM